MRVLTLKCLTQAGYPVDTILEPLACKECTFKGCADSSKCNCLIYQFKKYDGKPSAWHCGYTVAQIDNYLGEDCS